MKRYTVKLTPDSENTFSAVLRFDHDAVIELNDEQAIYTIDTEYDIDRLLDIEPGVVSYEVVEVS